MPLVLKSKYRLESSTMFNGSRNLTIELVKQFIWECRTIFNLPLQEKEKRPDIVLLGSRRSGSTLLLQILLQNDGLLGINQPFCQIRSCNDQRENLPYVASSVYLGLSECEVKELEIYLTKLLEVSIHVDEPWKIWRKEFKLSTNRCVLKTTDAHYLYDKLFKYKNNLNLVKYFRHPISQSLSCQRNSWGTKLNSFSQSVAFRDSWLTSKSANIFEDIISTGSGLEKYVLSWCCENLPLVQCRDDNALVVYYEHLVRYDKSVIGAIAEHCHLDSPDLMYKASMRASESTKKLSEKAAIDYINTGMVDQLLKRWKSQCSESELSNIQKILDGFEIDIYTAHDIYPTTGK